VRTGPTGLRAYHGYLFDLDGTLVDTAPDINAAMNAALRRAGFSPVSESLTRHWVGHGARVLMEQALDHQQQPHDALERLLGDFIAHYEAHIADHSRTYPGVREALEALRARGARLAVVTNKMTRLTLPLLDALELTPLFHSIVCGDTAAKPKPAADPALFACRALSLEIHDVLFVGDSETDVGCARAAGCDVVCVPDGYNHGVAPAALGADGIIDSFQDLV
jgi:phosphoglycolate phosphatase